MLSFLATLQEAGSAPGLLLAAVLLGLRHGIDWDHIAAISDMTASNDSRTGFRLGTLYALGHGAIVFVLGVVALLLGSRLPAGIDEAMGRVTGVTLLVLAAGVVWSLVHDRGEFKLRSRWLLVIVAFRKMARRISAARSREDGLGHQHDHAAVEGFHHTGPIDDGLDQQPGSRQGNGLRAPVHRHHHVHDDHWDQSSTRFALGVGMLHGIGAETPTQVVIFLAAAQAGGSATGITVLLAFLGGLFVSNSAVTLLGISGFSRVSARPIAHVTLALLTTAVSVAVGSMLLLGHEPGLL